MKGHSKIIKAFGLIVLIFVLASAVAVSEDACEITVTVEVSSSSEDGGDSNTVISTYDSETGLTKTTKISGSGTEEITTVGDATPSDGDTTPVDITPADTTPTESPDSEGNGANGDLNPDAEPTDLQLDESTYDDEWVELILSMIDADPFAIFDDFQGLDAIAAFE
jgi:hypothetical protein